MLNANLCAHMCVCIYMYIYIYVHIDACECSELIPLNIMTNVIFTLCLSLTDGTVNDGVSYTYLFFLFHNLYTY